jgi:two-component system response regulator (stage 0 sporulation protein F)
MPKPTTVLIVDDEPGIRKMLVEMLSLEGIPTEMAANGQEALDILATSGPRVVLLDLLMPVVDGRGVVEALRRKPGERERHRIILMSAVERLEPARDLDPDAMLAKPFTLTQLMSVIEPSPASA